MSQIDISSLSGLLVIDQSITSITSSTGTASCDVIVNSSLCISCSIEFSGNFIVQSGIITVPDGVVVTFSGDFSAPTRTIFSGSGIVLGIRMVKPEWWGASYTANSSAAIMSAYACASSSMSVKRGAVFMNGFLIDKRVSIKLSSNTSIDFIGGGTNLVGGRQKLSPTFADSCAFYFYCDSSSSVASFSLKNFAVENQQGTAAVAAFQFYGISGLTQHVVDTVVTTGFNYGFQLINTRLITLLNCATWKGSCANANGVYFSTSGAGLNTFVGDCKIINCQFETSGPGSSISASVVTSTHQCKGVHVSGTALYKSESGNQLYVYASSGAQIGDWLFDSTVQFDGYSSQFMTIIADGAGTVIDDFVFNGTYFRGSNSDGGITIYGRNGGIVRSCRFEAPFISNATGKAVIISGASGIIFRSANLYDCAGNKDAFSVIDSTSVLIDGIVATRSGGSYFSRLANIQGSSDYVTVSNCITSGIPSTAIVSDSSTGTHNRQFNNS